MKKTKPHIYQRARLKKRRGVTLFFALVALIAMALTGVALIRSVETSNLIAGNFAFRSAALSASDIGVEKAFSALGPITSGTLDANDPNGCTTDCRYYALKQATDANGIPVNINWAATNTDRQVVNNDYTVRYVIDRLCTGTLPITNLTRDCYSGATIGGGSKKSGGVVFSSTSELYFRVTVRVDGPRNTVSYAQAILAH